MSEDARLQALRQRWDVARQHGMTLSAEELCHDCPDLSDVVRQHLEQWQSETVSCRAEPISALHETLSRSVMPLAAPVAEVVLQVGEEPVAGYVLEKRLGKGGFGEVWRAKGPGNVP